MFKYTTLIVLSIVLALIVGFSGVNIIAMEVTQRNNAGDNSGDPQKITSLRELEALYPMSPLT